MATPSSAAFACRFPAAPHARRTHDLRRWAAVVVSGTALSVGCAGPGFAAAGLPAVTSTPGVRCQEPTVTVGTARELTAALGAARPGAVIALRAGVYAGRFVARTSGTATAPITLCGSADAILDAGGKSNGYVLHLDGASYWRVSGFTVRNGQKGVMADRVQHTIISGLTVAAIGDEAIHLRRASSDNQVVGNVIRGTGLRSKRYGEGIYVGTAQSNWSSVTGGAPDRSDRNVISGNTISGTTAEAVDLKEGTTGGKLVGNTFDGASITAADSAVDVKGNEWLISGNVVTNSPVDGFQTHRILSGWGDRNVFTANVVRSTKKTGGYVVALRPLLANVVRTDNTGPAGMQTSPATSR